MMKVLAIALLLGVAYAACPNQCSGHGRCNANDKCACYEQSNTPWGQRNGWVGADCSLRSCPLGRAFDQISSLDDRLGHVFYLSNFLAVDPTDTASVKPEDNSLVVTLDSNYLLTRDETIHVRISETGVSFQWRFATDAFYQQPVPITVDEEDAYSLTDHNTAGSPRSGILLHFTHRGRTTLNDEWVFNVKSNEEIYWVATNDNTLHQMEQCSGRGACNSATGRCECFVGYSGEACQRTTCPSDCSGHGVCQDQKHFANDAGESYTEYVGAVRYNLGPYDAEKQMGCLCDLGFRDRKSVV